jgi:hypothetical protein
MINPPAINYPSIGVESAQDHWNARVVPAYILDVASP